MQIKRMREATTHYTVINGRVVVDKGRITTMDLDRVVAQHNEESLKLAARAT